MCQISAYRLLSLFFILPLLLLSGVKSVKAIVTYNGTGGVAAQIFTPDCSACHFNGGQFPNHLDYTTAAANISTSITRINLNPADVGFMPDGGAKLSVAKLSLMSSWSGAATPLNAAPSVTTGVASSITKTTATIAGSVNDNGAEASYTVQWEVNDGSSVDPFANSTVATDNNSNSGGGLTNDSTSASLSGLSCGTTYQYRVVGTNSQGTVNGGTTTFSTLACNKVPLINAIATQSATEDSVFNFAVITTDQDGILSDSLTFTIIAGLTNSEINPATGLITWTPISESQTSVNVTVQVVDADADPGYTTDTESFLINITLVDDVPIFLNVPDNVVSAPEDFVYSFDYDAVDPEGAALSYSVSSLPDVTSMAPALTINSQTGLLSWTPDGTVTSIDVTVTVSDGNLSNDQTDTFTINVIGANDSPTISAIADQIINEEQLLVIDVDGADIDGDLLTYSLQSAPLGMTIDSLSGIINWVLDEVSPLSPVIETVVVGVSDGIILTPVTTSFTVTVNPVNDQPVFSAFAAVVLNELDNLIIDAAIQLTDPDDDNDGINLSWSLANAPPGLSLSLTGLIEWIPGEETANTYNVSVSVADGLEDGSSIQSQSLVIVVNKLDSDGDTVADYNDNCPTIANTDQANLDGDEFGDACETDTDGDGISDVAEIANGLDPRDAEDANQDLDGDGLTNLEEFELCLDQGEEECGAISIDSVAPAINVSDITMVAQGYITKVVLTASALDGNDGVVVVTADKKGLFRPGRHVVTWTATDAVGNEAIVEQNINIIPLLSLAGSQVVTEGQTLSVLVKLNGDAPSYPVLIDYLVSGTADNSDHDLSSGSLQITSSASGQINLNILTDNILENDEEIIITISGVSNNAVLTDSLVHNILITEQATPPAVKLSISQNELTSNTVYQDRGMVFVVAQAEDINADPLVFDWSQSELWANATNNQAVLTFDPNELQLASYKIIVEVSDGTFISRQEKTIVVKQTAPILSAFVDSDNDGIFDATEGFNDSDGDGLLDYLDAVDEPTLLHSKLIKGGDNYSRLLQSQHGVSLKVGRHILAAQLTGALITSDNIRDQTNQIIEDVGNTFVGGLYDFEIHGVSALDKNIKVVIPLSQAIPNDARYRKLIDNNWLDFETSATDSIASAKSSNNICPLPNSNLYQIGLTAFDDCLQLTLSDGGPNDADGLVNGVIVDPGGISIANKLNNGDVEAEIPTQSPGGGSLNYFILILISFGICFFIWKKRD